MKFSMSSFLYPIIFMTIVTAIFIFLLAGLNHLTIDAIALNEETDLRSKILYVFDIDVPSNEPEIIEKTFNEQIRLDRIGEETIYYITEGEEVLAYAFPVEGVALWGSLKAYVAVTADYSEIVGIEFISHSETPGLGGRISEQWFKEQFRGLDLTKAEDGEYVIYRPSPGGNVDAVSGATLTSNSIRDILNKSIHEFITDKGGDY